jgi:chromosome segregation ATPase
VLETNELAKLTERVAILENQSTQLNSVIHKLEIAIDRLSEVSGSLREFIAIHDHRLQKIEDDVDTNYTEERDARKSLEAQVHEVRGMVISMEMKLSSHIRSEENMLNEQERTLSGIEASINKFGERIGSLEKWRWLVVGGAIVAYFVFTLGTKIVTEGGYQLPHNTQQQNQQNQRIVPMPPVAP